MNPLQKFTILDLPQRLKVSRNLSVLGSYSDSLRQYKISLSIIQERQKEIEDSFLKEKWNEIEKEVKGEMLQVTALQEVCNEFKRVYIDKDSLLLRKDESKVFKSDLDVKNDLNNICKPNKHSNSQGKSVLIGNDVQKSKDKVNKPKVIACWNEDSSQKIMDSKQKLIKNQEDSFDLTRIISNFQVKDGKNKENNQDTKEIKEIPKKPYENIEKNDDTLSFMINNFNKEVYSDDFNKQTPNQTQDKTEKDPMIWEKPSNNLNLKKEKNKKTQIPLTNKQKIKETERSSIENKGKPVLSNENNKKSYLFHIYPDGTGPDSHLIQQLEEEVVDLNPNITFDDIADLSNAKNVLKEAVILPLNMPNFFIGIRRPWKGVLLYGPPGTGKTLLAKAMATQGKTTFFNVHSSSFGSKWRGESEKLVRILFEMAKFYAPTIIFIDEVDAVGSRRTSNDDDSTRRVKTEFLVQMDGCNSFSTESSQSNQSNQSKLIMVLGATNRPWDLDEALIRRFEKRVYIPLPSEKGRHELFKINLKSLKLKEGIDFQRLVDITKNYSGADISNVCREAAFMGMRRRMIDNKTDISLLAKESCFRREIDEPVSEEDLIVAIGNISKSVSNVDMKNYEDWTNEFKSV